MTDPIQPELIEQMNEFARMACDFFKPYGFALLVFPFSYEEGQCMNYISNANREDMLAAMKEFIANAEGRLHEAGIVQ